MSRTLRIGYFYPELLNLYGDNGNVEILAARARAFGCDAEIIRVSTNTPSAELPRLNINLIFMGGGPDSAQKRMYEDLYNNKADFLWHYVDDNGVGLYICGSYQLLGDYYKSADGSVLDGLSIFDLYTEHFGIHVPRCIGNTVARLSGKLTEDPVFKPVAEVGDRIVGFENHGGRTFLGKGTKPFARIIRGHGNNSQDGTEGVLYKNSIGTYFHGPILARNPQLANYLIYKALNLREDEIAKLPKLDDTLIVSAHTASLKLR